MLLHPNKPKRTAVIPSYVYLTATLGMLSLGMIAASWLATRPENLQQQSGALSLIQNPLNFRQIVNRQQRISALPLLSLSLKYEDSYQMQQRRQQALLEGVITDSKQDFVSATLTYQSESMPIELRLKPGPVEALATRQWPYEVEIENDDRPLGMKRFSLYAPDVDSFHSEQLWLDHLQAEGLLARRTRLVRLEINGSSQGVFALEDEFSKELIKASKRSEGLFLQYVEQGETVALEATRPGHLEKYAGLQRQEESAIAQLAAFSEGALSAQSVFDLEATATYLAIASLWPEESALHSPRTYFYYDPTTAKMEPVGYHFQPNAFAKEQSNALAAASAFTAPKTTSQLDAPELSQWIVRLFQDPDFVSLYQQERKRITKRAYSENLQQSLIPKLEAQQKLLHSPISAIASSNNAEMWDRLKQRMAAADTLSRKANSLRVRSLSAQGILSSGEKSGAKGRQLLSPTTDELLQAHPFLGWDSFTQTLFVLPGTWDVSGDLITPSGMPLLIESGTQLLFESDALLLARGPLDFVGSKERPIMLSSQQNSWAGIELWNAKDSSELKHVRIENTTGGTFVYDSPIEITNSQIINSSARDALKLIDSDFLISESLFQDVKDDAIDTDNANGQIESSLFSQIGGDGIDLSESDVSVAQVSLRQVGDKGISVGQNSQLTAQTIVVEDAAMAIASLDGSTVAVDSLIGRRLSKVGLAAFSERVGFASASMSASDVQFEDVEYNAIAQANSRIVFNGEMLKGNPQSSYLLYQATGISNN